MAPKDAAINRAMLSIPAVASLQSPCALHAKYYHFPTQGLG